MKPDDKKVLLARIETLKWSIADTQLQTTVGLLEDIVKAIPIFETGRILGFGPKEEEK